MKEEKPPYLTDVKLDKLKKREYLDVLRRVGLENEVKKVELAIFKAMLTWSIPIGYLLLYTSMGTTSKELTKLIIVAAPSISYMFFNIYLIYYTRAVKEEIQRSNYKLRVYKESPVKNGIARFLSLNHGMTALMAAMYHIVYTPCLILLYILPLLLLMLLISETTLHPKISGYIKESRFKLEYLYGNE